jgi:Arc/MetJ-type ribon-helix-helix transcriptional regulator
MTRHTRSSRDDPREKTGYRIPRSVVAMVREAVEAGEAKSQNEFVERALTRELQAVRQRRLYEEYALAAEDPGFTSDMEEVVSDFEPTTHDGLHAEEP